MTYLLDTDHISLLQRPAAAEHPAITARLSANATAGVGTCVVSFQEQTRGANSRVTSARTPAEVLHGYRLSLTVFDFFKTFPVLPFDAPAEAEFARLRTDGVRIGTLDLRIASIALTRGLTVVTRNVRDFGRVPELRTEDWTR